jgi:tRNA(Ile2) C34 agmatinyltransferase TiaS
VVINMKKNLFVLCVILSGSFAEASCENILQKLHTQLPGDVQLNLKRAQELAEDFVNRKVASEVLTDPGVELAMEESHGVAEAIEEALLSRGMSPGQAKKASEGWTSAMKSDGIFGKTGAVTAPVPAVASGPINLKRAQELAEDFVNRKVASEVLTDPGVELAMEESHRVAEAIEEALLARGMSSLQAKKASEGWTRVLESNGVIQTIR